MAPATSNDPLDLSKLSPKEREVLERGRSGSTAIEIARQLWLTEATVRTHLSHIYEKLGVRSRVELLARLQATAPMSTNAPVPTEVPASHGRVNARRPDEGTLGTVLVSVVGAAVGMVVGFALLPATAVSPPAVLLLPLLGGAPLAVVIARRRGGPYFFAALIGACGAVLVALSLAPGLSCPAGEFSPECVRPAVAPILLPGLSLTIGGLLIASWATRSRVANDHSAHDIQQR